MTKKHGLSFSDALKVMQKSEHLSIYRLTLGGMVSRYGKDLVYFDVSGHPHVLSKYVRARDKNQDDWQVCYVAE